MGKHKFYLNCALLPFVDSAKEYYRQEILKVDGGAKKRIRLEALDQFDRLKVVYALKGDSKAAFRMSNLGNFGSFNSRLKYTQYKVEMFLKLAFMESVIAISCRGINGEHKDNK